jgi:nucleoside-diphosphate-sugar epimerase
MPRAFITGITGQDGRHLAEFLHGKGYQVYGMVTGQNNPKAITLQEEMPFIEVVPGDPTFPRWSKHSRWRSPTRSTTSARSRSSR